MRVESTSPPAAPTPANTVARSLWQQARRLTLIPVMLALPLAAHSLLRRASQGPEVTLLIWAQLSLAGIVVCSRFKSPRGYLIAGLVTVGALLGACDAESGLILSTGIPHTLVYLGLLLVFGRSLRPGGEPVVTYFARAIHGMPSPDLARYTRRITAAWCLFFFLQILVSGTLLLCAPLGWWSAFVNLLNIPLVLLMLGVERMTRAWWVAAAPKENFHDILRLADLIRAKASR